MALVLIDRVQETGTANTTVSFTLSGAMTSYQSFGAIGTGNTTYYGATDGTNWEVGLGTYTTSPNTLTRTTILSSSNSGSAVTFSGTVTVWCDYPAGKQISSDYPNALGVVTPAAGTFTTITGQTEVLKGTGQNLLIYSNAFSTTAGWGLGAASLTGSQSDPFGGSTAWLLTGDGTSAQHNLTNAALNFVNGITYTYSIYAKKGTNNYFQMLFASSIGGAYANFDLNAGTVGTSGNGATPSILFIGSGWYRCSITATVTASASATSPVYLVTSASAGRVESNTLSTNISIYGTQLEIGSTLNAYVATTTTAVYGTPTLSFSGVAGLGLQSDGSLYVSPAGTGALQAQATTSSTAGGNARGANAVDWQTSRSAATQVASGANTVIAGGQNNTASIQFGAVGGGTANANNAYVSTIGGGFSNTTSRDFAVIGGGYLNTAAGFYNYIGGGFSNSGTASAAVTTQAAATNGVTSGSTAVTLAASNAAIKVGQYITGTGIVTLPPTFVAAISGTSLTLSQNANATGTPTLSFYTPHGVVVGGGNNQATGSYSFIGGGGDAGTAANRNTASGDWSFVGGGQKNTASGIGSVVVGGGTNGSGVFANSASGAGSISVGGFQNASSGTGSVIVGGYANTSTSNYSFVGAGQNNQANSNFSVISGGAFGTARSIIGNAVFPASSTPISSTLGVSQASMLILARQTTDATATVLTSDTNSAGSTNQVILPNNSAYYFKVSVIANVTGGGNTKAWTLEGAIKRGSGVGTAAIVGTVTTTIVAADLGAATWTVTATADTTNGGLAITFTGQASTTIRVVARVDTTEVTF